MSDTELLLKKIEGLPPGYMAQVFDFIDQLTHKAPAPAKTPEPEAAGEPDVFDQAARLLGYKDDLDYLRSNTPKTLEEAIEEAERKFNDPKRKPFSRHYGILAGDNAYGDGMAYQRKMRDEWN